MLLSSGKKYCATTDIREVTSQWVPRPIESVETDCPINAMLKCGGWFQIIHNKQEKEDLFIVKNI